MGSVIKCNGRGDRKGINKTQQAAGQCMYKEGSTYWLRAGQSGRHNNVKERKGKVNREQGAETKGRWQDKRAMTKEGTGLGGGWSVGYGGD